jgi:hypothetical protein
MMRALLALVLAAAAAPMATAADPLAAIDACVRHLDPALDVGYPRIAERCPELAASLKGSAYAVWLPPDWDKLDNNLSVGGLLELRTLLSRPFAGTVHAPQVAHLAPFLAQLRAPPPQQRSWWARFKNWLRGALNTRTESGEAGPLERLLDKINPPQVIVRLIVWGALFLLVALAATIIVNELRLAGLLRRWRPRGGAAPQSGTRDEPMSLAALMQLGVRERPRLLLELILKQLTRQRRLPPARALTVRELQGVVQLPADARAHLAELAAACEQLRFAAQEPAPAALAATTARGAELLTLLTSSTGGAEAR